LGVNSELNILEIGLGTNNPILVSSMGSLGRPGASLYAFAEYLPNANIYGADIDENILFKSNRIKTSYVDQLNSNTFDEMSNNFSNVKYDLIIDDGLHSDEAVLNTFASLHPFLSDQFVYFVEDSFTAGRAIKRIYPEYRKS
jgi:23S rRNA U2552 (ribose-2'-O)-methylase RlmE/FtsJ